MATTPIPPNSQSRRRPPLIILVLVTALGPLALNILVPSMPGLQRVFAAGYDVVQLVLSLYLLGIGFGQLIYGPLSDHFGRRPLLLIGLGVFLVGTIGCIYAPNIETLIGFRVLQALGGCAGMVLARAMIRDLFARERAASILAYVTMAMVLAPMLAPTIGGALDVWFGWWAGFVFILVVGLLVMFFATFSLHETHVENRVTLRLFSPFYDARRLFGQPSFRGHAFQVAFTTSVFFTFIAGAPFVMIEIMGRTPADYGVYFIMVPCMYISGNFLTGRYSQRIGTDRMITIGTMFSFLVMVVLLAIYFLGFLSPFYLFAGMALIAFGHGLSVANGIMGALSVDSKLIGSASGISGFLQMGIGAAAASLVGSLLQTTAMPLLLIMFGGAFLAFTSHWLCVRKSRNQCL
ncbi:multidrug effflux MFS transporter [Pseudomonadota bacterium]